MVKVYKPVSASIPPKQTIPTQSYTAVFPKVLAIGLKSSTASGAVVYTVPAGKTFVCTSAYLAFFADNATGGGEVDLLVDDVEMIKLYSTNPGAGQTFNDNISLPFGEGLRFPSGPRFTLFIGSSQRTTAGVYGFLVENKDLYYLDNRNY